MTTVLSAMIVKLQNVQRRNPPTSVEWQAASRDLNSLFEKVATLAPEMQALINREIGNTLPPR